MTPGIYGDPVGEAAPERPGPCHGKGVQTKQKDALWASLGSALSFQRTYEIQTR